MAKLETLHLGAGCSITTDRDHNGRWWITYYKGASLFHRDSVAVRKALKMPRGIPSREKLDAWMKELEASDQERRAAVKTADIKQTWGPEAHADEEDPVTSNKMII